MARVSAPSAPATEAGQPCLALLQGYADIMEGLGQAPSSRPAIDDCRRVRQRTRQLMTEHRNLLGAFHDRVSKADDHVSDG